MLSSTKKQGALAEKNNLPSQGITGRDTAQEQELEGLGRKEKQHPGRETKAWRHSAFWEPEESQCGSRFSGKRDENEENEGGMVGRSWTTCGFIGLKFRVSNGNIFLVLYSVYSLNHTHIFIYYVNGITPYTVYSSIFLKAFFVCNYIIFL